MWRVYGGAIMVIAGIAAFIEGHSNRPEYGCPGGASRCAVGSPEALQPGSLSQTTYDLLRIGAWALVILGALTVILGLIRYWMGARG